MTKALTTTEAREIANLTPDTLEALVLNGDLSKLNQGQLLAYYKYRCEVVGLDPSTKPFDVLVLGGKKILYATKECSSQLSENHKLSPTIISTKTDAGIYEVQARVAGPDGRMTDDIGCVSIDGLKGEALCNARMKSVTKAKRRAILTHCGLGMPDESEIETIPGARIEPAPPAPVKVTPIEPAVTQPDPNPVTQETYTIKEPERRETHPTGKEGSKTAAPSSPVKTEAKQNSPSGSGEQAFKPYKVKAMSKEKTSKKGQVFRSFLLENGAGAECWVNAFSSSQVAALMAYRKGDDLAMLVLQKDGDFTNIEAMKGVSDEADEAEDVPTSEQMF